MDAQPQGAHAPRADEEDTELEILPVALPPRPREPSNDDIRLFDAAITPTICFASGTWAPTKEHERMIQSAQRKMLRLIKQTKRRYKKIVKHQVKTGEDLNNIDSSCTDDESEDGKSSVSHNDQDSDVSFESDNDEEIDAAEIKEEDWVDYI